MKLFLPIIFIFCAAPLFAQPVVWDNMDACSGNWNQSSTVGAKQSFRNAVFDTAAPQSREGGCYLAYATADTFHKNSFVGWFAQQKFQVWHKPWLNFMIYTRDGAMTMTVDLADDADGDSTTLNDVDTLRSVVKTLHGGWQEINLNLKNDFTDINPAVGNNILDSTIRSLTFRFSTTNTYLTNDTIYIRVDEIQNSDTTGFSFLDFSPDSINPDVLFGQNLTFTVQMQSSGSTFTPIQNIAITGPGAAFYTIQHQPDTINFNQFDSIVINYAPTALENDTATLTFQTNSVNNPSVSIPILGISDSAIATSDKFVMFPLASCAVGNSLNDGAVVRNTGRVPLIMMNYDSINGPGQSDYRTIAGYHGIINPGRTDSMVIKFSPSLSGYRPATLKLFYRKTMSQIDSIFIPMLGEGGRASINVTPLQVVDSMVLGQSSSFWIHLINYGTYGVHMQRQLLLGNDASNFRIVDTLSRPLFPSIEDSIEVQCTPSTLGLKFAYVELVTDAQNEPVVVIPITMFVGTRILTSNPSDIFETDTALVGSTITRSVLCQSTGTLPVTIDSVRLLHRDTSGSFTIVRIPKPVLAPGKKDTLTVNFTPPTQGIKIDTIIIYTNSPTVPFITVALHGFAGARRIFASDTLLIDTVTVNKTFVRCFTIRDSGNLPITISNIVVGGTNADQFTLVKPTIFPISVPPGKIDTICVSVTPTSAGDKFAQVLIQTDAQNFGNFYINLHTYGTTVGVIDPWEQPFSSVITASPNPFRDATALHIDLASSEKIILLGVFDLLGREVQDLTHDAAAAADGARSIEPVLHMDGYPAGMYFVRLATTARTSVAKIVVNK